MTGRPHVDVQNAKTRAGGEYAEALTRIAAEGVCPFCEPHLARHHPKPVLFRNDYWIVTENAYPYAGVRHQWVIIFREHVESAAMLPAEAWAALGDAYQRLVRDWRVEGGALLLRTGLTEFTGASVAHLHAQLISGHRRRPDSEPLRALVGYKR
jgi:ATP adenylyltransferase